MSPIAYLKTKQGFQACKALIFSPKARPLRFICTGGVCAVMQLSILALLTHYHWHPIIANSTAFLLSGQINFCLSFLFTWHDRQPTIGTKHIILARWLGFHCSIAATFFLNLLFFTLIHMVLSTVLASAVSIILVAVLNFAIMNRLIFHKQRVAIIETVELEPVAIRESQASL